MFEVACPVLSRSGRVAGVAFNDLDACHILCRDTNAVHVIHGSEEFRSQGGRATNRGNRDDYGPEKDAKQQLGGIRFNAERHAYDLGEFHRDLHLRRRIADVRQHGLQ